MVLTSKGRGVAVVQSLQDYEANMEHQSFMKAVVKGLVDLEEDRELNVAELREHLKI